MSPFNLVKSKIIVTFWMGILIFGFLIPGCISLTTNSPLKANSIATQEAVVTTANPRSNSNSPLGVGLNGIADWSTELPFLDAFKLSRKWITQCVKADPDCQGEFDTHESALINLDEKGWVKSLPRPSDPPKYTRVSTFILVGMPNRFPSGKYLVLYEGEGTLEYGLDAKKDNQSSTLGRDVIEVDASKGNGVMLTITSTDPQNTGNYLRNIRVIKPEFENTFVKEVFNPVFLDKIKRFRALRFMDWMSTNYSEQKEWADRPKPEIASYALKGAPLEIMVALANKVKADPWFNIPHQATDDYITKFAQLVKEQLNPGLKVYIEFSNEVWNGAFSQSQYAGEQGKARWGQDKADAYVQWYGMRTAQMCDIWKRVFGNEQNRVVCVISTQTAWKGLENQVLDCPYWVAEGNKPCYQHGIDVYAVTGYFSGGLGSPENYRTVESWLQEPDGGFSKAIQQLREGGLLANTHDSLPDTYNGLKYHLEVAKRKQLNLVTYEGGQHIVGVGEVANHEKLTQFFIELNRRPEMHDLYLQLLNDWKRAGGTLFMHFVDIGVASKWGSWGALEYAAQNGSPKYNALIEFIDKNPCWWERCARK
ncbi:MAG: cellulose-binding protein [Actinomycetota bacterium]